MSDPYTSPQMISQPESGLPALEPKSIQVFGILHLIFGILGILSTVLGLVFILFMKPFFNLLGDVMAAESPAPAPGAPAVSDPAEMMRLMGDMYTTQQPYYLVSSTVTLLLFVLMVRAGFSLVKRKKSAAKRSNLWAWLVIGGLLLSLPISLLYTLPAQQEAQEKMLEALGTPAATGSGQSETIFQVFGVFMGLIFSMIYPVLALIFIKKKTVHDYLEEYGK